MIRPADNDVRAWSKLVDRLIKSEDELAPPQPVLVTGALKMSDDDDQILPEEDPTGLVSIHAGLMEVVR